MVQRSAVPTGLICLVVGLAAAAGVAAITGPGPVLRISAPAVAAGSLLGLCLAGITRTRRPLQIYLLVGCAVVPFWVLKGPWPPLRLQDVLTAGSTLEKAETRSQLLELLRAAAFILAIPFPYGQFGHHGPDSQPSPESEHSDSEPN
jgi:hypothetical protein